MGAAKDCNMRMVCNVGFQLTNPKGVPIFMVSYQCHILLCLIMSESKNWTIKKAIKLAYTQQIQVHDHVSKSTPHASEH